MSSLSSLILKTLQSGWCLRWMRFSGSQTCEHGCFACKKSGESSRILWGSRFVLVFGLLCFIGRSTHPWKEVPSWLENMPFFYGDLNLVSLSESDSFAFERDFQQCFLKFWLVVVYIRGLYYPLIFRDYKNPISGSLWTTQYFNRNVMGLVQASRCWKIQADQLEHEKLIGLLGLIGQLHSFFCLRFRHFLRFKQTKMIH